MYFPLDHKSWVDWGSTLSPQRVGDEEKIKSHSRRQSRLGFCEEEVTESALCADTHYDFQKQSRLGFSLEKVTAESAV